MNKRAQIIAAVESEHGEPFLEVVRGFVADGESKQATAAILGTSDTMLRTLTAGADIQWRRPTETNGWINADRPYGQGNHLRAANENLRKAWTANADRFATTRKTTPELMARVTEQRAAGVSWRAMPAAVGTDLDSSTLRRRHKALENRHAETDPR